MCTSGYKTSPDVQNAWPCPFGVKTFTQGFFSVIHGHMAIGHTHSVHMPRMPRFCLVGSRSFSIMLYVFPSQRVGKVIYMVKYTMSETNPFKD